MITLTPESLSYPIVYLDQNKTSISPGEPAFPAAGAVTVTTDHPEFVTAAISADNTEIVFTIVADGAASVTVTDGTVTDTFPVSTYIPVLTSIEVVGQ